MARKVLIWCGSAILPILFLNCALRPGCAFNFIPFGIHEALLRGTIDEGIFIITFDIAFAVVLFFGTSWLLRRGLSSASYTPHL